MALSFRLYITAYVIWAMLGAVIICSPVYAQTAAQPIKKGLTFTIGSGADAEQDRNIGVAYCGKTERGAALCDPVIGDTNCSARLPLLCIRDIDAAVPINMSDPNYWTGGVLSKSPPHTGVSITTLAQANHICAKSFGQDWRVVSFHDGGGWAVKGYGNLTDLSDDKILQRVWIDIKNKPNATCWGR